MVRRGRRFESVRGLCKSPEIEAFSVGRTCTGSSVRWVWSRGAFSSETAPVSVKTGPPGSCCVARARSGDHSPPLQELYLRVLQKVLTATRWCARAVDAAGAPRDRQQSTQTALLGAERFPDVSTALSTTSVNPMPWTVQYAIVELPPMMLSG